VFIDRPANPAHVDRHKMTVVNAATAPPYESERPIRQSGGPKGRLTHRSGRAPYPTGSETRGCG
jgi:hypothetical protein